MSGLPAVAAPLHTPPVCASGETARSLETLRHAIAKGFADDGWLKHDPDLDPLRDTPEFIALMARR